MLVAIRVAARHRALVERTTHLGTALAGTAFAARTGTTAALDDATTRTARGLFAIEIATDRTRRTQTAFKAATILELALVAALGDAFATAPAPGSATMRSPRRCLRLDGTLGTGRTTFERALATRGSRLCRTLGAGCTSFGGSYTGSTTLRRALTTGR